MNGRPSWQFAELGKQLTAATESERLTANACAMHYHVAPLRMVHAR
jgi:hypothetical protein